MSAAPATADDDYAAWAEALLREQAQLVAELSRGAARMAAAIEAKAGAEPAKSDATTYTRLYRSTRMGSLLLGRLVKEIGKVRSGERFDASRREREAMIAAALADPAHDHKARVEHIVERIAKAEHGDDEDRIDRLVAECAERLDDEDIYRDVRTLPVKDLVQSICRALDLDPKPFLHEAWATETPSPPPAELAGGGPSAEEPMVEGAGGYDTAYLSSA